MLCEVLDRIDAPESKENYEHFRAPYPPPLPLLKEEGKQDVKIKVEGTQKRHGDDREYRDFYDEDHVQTYPLSQRKMDPGSE
jgi:hypothetical protein